MPAAKRADVNRNPMGYAGRPGTFVIDLPPRPSPGAGRWLSWREAEEWERAVVERAYAAGAARDAALVQVAGGKDKGGKK